MPASLRMASPCTVSSTSMHVLLVAGDRWRSLNTTQARGLSQSPVGGAQCEGLGSGPSTPCAEANARLEGRNSRAQHAGARQVRDLHALARSGEHGMGPGGVPTPHPAMHAIQLQAPCCRRDVGMITS